MANIHLCLLLALVTFHGVYQGVDAVACAKDSDCVSTYNVLPKCRTSGLCECKPGFYPILTGCGTRLPKPTLSISDTDSSTPEAYDKAAVTLRCLVSASVSGKLRYVWSENGKIVAGETGRIYAFTADVNKIDTTYTCKATLRNTYDSIESNSVQVTVISRDTAPTNKPSIFSYNAVVPGGTIWLNCKGLPLGSSSYDIEFKDANKKVDTKAVQVQADSQFTCHYKGMISLPLEILTENFPKPTLAAFNRNHSIDGTAEVTATRVMVKQDDHVYIECAYHLGSLDTLAVRITSHFYKNNAVVQPHSITRDSIEIDTSTPGESVYACSGELTGAYTLKETKSDTITIIVQEDDPVPEPFIVLEPEVTIIGGHLSLTCLTNDISDLEYKWSRNGNIIYGQSDKTIQLHNVRLSADYYSCSVSKDVRMSTSKAIHAVTLPQPILSLTGATDLSNLTAGSTFPLVCQLAAAPKGINYRFYKERNRIPGRLVLVNTNDDGRYKCATFFRNAEMSSSEELVIAIDPNGNNENNNGQSMANSLVGILLCLVVSNLVNTL